MKLRVKKGFSYIELIIILFISATIFSGILPLIYKSITANREAKLRLIAYQAAHQEVENIRGQAISSLTDHYFSVANIPGALGRLTINKTIEGEEQTNIGLVTSKVTWQFKGKNQQVELNTYLYGSSE